jgi:hypothetical protein
MGLTLEQAAALGLAHLHPEQRERDSRPGKLVDPDGMNATERRYGVFLESLKHAERIRDYAFSPEKLRLAGRTFYTPDFRIVTADGSIEFHETKGFMRDDAAVKVKVAAVLHPCYTFRVAFAKRGGAFDIRIVTTRGIDAVGGWEPSGKG